MRVARTTEAEAESTGAVVAPSGTAVFARLAPLGGRRVVVEDPFWVNRASTNRSVSLEEAYARLEEYGALPYLRAAAEGRPAPVVKQFNAPTFYRLLDSDVYKWLEALAYEHVRQPLDAGLLERAEAVIDLIARAQRDDGFVQTWALVHDADTTLAGWTDSYVPYCAAHLIQAGVAWARAFGTTRLLECATGMADFIRRSRADFPDMIPLHPGLEMALVELYRETGVAAHLELAKGFIDRRGRNSFGWWKFTPDRYIDDTPLRELTSVHGHAVMALYLLCGMVDVAVETGDRALLAAAEAQWEDFVGTKMYITGGAGSMHYDEAFGRPYELSPDTAYAETCAAVASTMLAWRLLLATGRGRYADVIERTYYNGLLAGGALDGHTYFYVNPLQVREAGRVLSPDGYGHRQPWFECACCPPNLMRAIATFGQLAYTADSDGLQLQQYVTGTIDAPVGRLRVKSNIPFGDGRVVVTVETAASAEWTMAFRVPEWASRPELVVNGVVQQAGRDDLDEDGYFTIRRRWTPGDEVRLETDPEFAQAVADDRLDAVRGQAAIVRGPLVYCLEGMDLPDSVALDAVRLPAHLEVEVGRPDEFGIPSAVASLLAVPPAPKRLLPYARVDEVAAGGEPRTFEAEIRPYFAWGNHGPTTMRVWLPTAQVAVSDSRAAVAVAGAA